MIAKENLLAYFEQFDIKQSTNDWWRFNNPLEYSTHDDISMAVNFEYMWVKDFRGWSGHVFAFIAEYEGIEFWQARKLIEELDYTPSKRLRKKLGVKQKFTSKRLELPEGFKLITEPAGSLGVRAQAYLKSRHISLTEAEQLHIGYCSTGRYAGYIIIPFIRKGELVYYNARAFTNAKPKYLNPRVDDYGIKKAELFYNEDALQIHDTVFICEGAIDAITVGSMGCATMGWALSNVQRSKLMRAKASTFVICADRGFYQRAIATFAPFIGIKSVRVIDPSLMQGKDVNDWGNDAVHELAEMATKLDHKTILKHI